jgi:hypothetical protein
VNASNTDGQYRPCNACRKPIGFNAQQYVCSVSTCTRKRTGMVFCSVACWQTHVPVLRHRDAWAIEEKSPSREAWARENADDDARPAPRIITSQQPEPTLNDAVPDDILIVASKLKQYIKSRSGMNTSDGVMTTLSDRVRTLCDEAIREAGRDDRKTVMDRDFKKL